MIRAASLLFVFLPVAGAWAAWHERRILRAGTPLSDEGLKDASFLGVRHPERIRILRVGKIPILNGRLLRAMSKFWPQISVHTIGLSLRYGIYLREGCAIDRQRELIGHECVHTAQYEECGGILKFLVRYFSECVRYGYLAAPMEMEAVEGAGKISSVKCT